jgi:hypothetical protein
MVAGDVTTPDPASLDMLVPAATDKNNDGRPSSKIVRKGDAAGSIALSEGTAVPPPMAMGSGYPQIWMGVAIIILKIHCTN